MADLVLARTLAQQLLDALADTPIPAPIPEPPALPITSRDELDRALAASAPGDILTLSTTYVDATPLVLKQSIVLLSELVGDGRMDRETPTPRFTGGLTITGNGVRLVGIEIRHPDAGKDIVVISGEQVTLDRCRILGDPNGGGKRGIAANGSAMTIRRSYVDDCFGPYPGSDTQAICCWDMGGGLLIEDCYLSGGSETIMIGGSDPASEERSPRDIIIRHNTISKNPAWKTKTVGVKNTLELKNARNVRIEDNDIEYSWGGHGQDGYLLMLTVRNQGGNAPYSTIEDVTIQNNRFTHAAAAIAILASDNLHPSQRMARVAILDNTFFDLDPATYGKGSKRMILIQRGPTDMSITGNTFSGVGLSSQVYFDGLPKCEALIIADNVWPKTTYGVFGTGATVGKAWDQYVASGILGPNTEVTS